MIAEYLKAKTGFKYLVAKYHAHILHYHAGNGQFGDKGFLEACARNRQSVNFFSPQTHFQNGISESNIVVLQDYYQSIFLNAIYYLLEMILVDLCIHDLLEETRIANLVRFDSYGCAPLSYLSG